MNRVDSFLELAVRQGGSDLHLVSGQTPRIRIDGLLHPVRFRELTEEDVTRILEEFMPGRHREIVAERQQTDFAYEVPGLGRFRCSVYRHAGGLAAAFRVIPSRLRPLEELGLPESVAAVIRQPTGLTLVTGPTGCGKSTTLAAIVDRINTTRKGHVITLEDPIEYVHEFKSCVITQREIGTSAGSFAEALRHAVREDPDVILVGEMRDEETVGMALTAAETGIQVFGTLHTNGAVRAVDRVVNSFPARRQEQIRTVLAETLRLVVSQQLVRLADGTGRRVAAEVLINNTAAASMIRSGQSHKLTSVMQAGVRSGMQNLDPVLMDLVRRDIITGEEAYEHAIDRTQFERYLERDNAA